MKQEEPKWKNLNVVLLIFWGCLNNYLADVVSKAAITPGRRAPQYQWGQQSVHCLRWGDNTLTPNSVQPAFRLFEQWERLTNQNHNVLHACHCVPRWGVRQPIESKYWDRWSYLFSSTLCLLGACPFLIERPFGVCHGESLILNSGGCIFSFDRPEFLFCFGFFF